MNLKNKFLQKSITLPAVLLAGFLLTACGAGKEPMSSWIGIGPDTDLTAVTERTEYYDLTVEQEDLFPLGLLERNPAQYSVQLLPEGEFVYALLGTQYAFEEPVQFWSEVSAQKADVYLYRTDGSRELLLKGIPSDYASRDSRFQLFMDRDKNCYFYRTNYVETDGEYRQIGTVLKMLPSGELQYESTLEPGLIIEDICQTPDGRIYLLLLDYENSRRTAGELEPETGQLFPGRQAELSMGAVYLGTADGSLAAAGLCNRGGYGIAAVDMAAGSTSPFLYFSGTSYGWHHDMLLQDFQVLEDDTIKLLWTDRPGQNCFQEELRMEKVEKTPIVLRGIFFADTWLSRQVSLFNAENDNYHVILESCGYGIDLDDFSRLTSVQIGAGKGPDILCGSQLLGDGLEGMIDKGVLEVLNPYLTSSGIREEDYFPLVFSSWRRGGDIYGITPKMEVYYEEINAEALGDRNTPDITALADALLAREENQIYRKGLTSGDVLNTFLQGSEDLWGSIDWEAGTCDFNTPLFAKLLEAAKRYGYEPGKELQPEAVSKNDLDSFFSFHSSAQREAAGLVPSGILFDEGCYAVSLPLYTMAVNANSLHKEGAWEFLSFLLEEKVQYREEWFLPPVHRASFNKWLEWELYDLTEKRLSNGTWHTPTYYGADTSKEKQEEYKEAIAGARPLPTRTAPILSIVLEEAADYFNGSKSAGDICRIINNRVQLFLSEQLPHSR